MACSRAAASVSVIALSYQAWATSFVSSAFWAGKDMPIPVWSYKVSSVHDVVSAVLADQLYMG